MQYIATSYYPNGNPILGSFNTIFIDGRISVINAHEVAKRELKREGKAATYSLFYVNRLSDITEAMEAKATRFPVTT